MEYRKANLSSHALMFTWRQTLPVVISEDDVCVTGPCTGHDTRVCSTSPGECSDCNERRGVDEDDL